MGQGQGLCRIGLVLVWGRSRVVVAGPKVRHALLWVSSEQAHAMKSGGPKKDRGAPDSYSSTQFSAR